MRNIVIIVIINSKERKKTQKKHLNEIKNN